MKVLIADDDKIFVEILASRFRAKGVDVLAAFDRMQTMMHAMRGNPDIVLLDINLPGGSGLDALKTIRGSAKTAGLPVIIISGLEDKRLRDQVIAAGASEYLRKPVTYEQVQAAVDRVLGIGNSGAPVPAPPTLRVRPIQEGDWGQWRRMRMALWPNQSAEENESDMRDWQQRKDAAVFVALNDQSDVCGFVEVATRSIADGCVTSPVAYVEGIYVDTDSRRKGGARSLFTAAEHWARSGGLKEIASDASLDNAVSHQVHARLGYAEVDRVVLYRKSLSEG